MNTEQIRKRLSNGFKPFALVSSSGKRYPVPHPEFVVVGRNIVVIVGEDDLVDTIDALHITAIEDLPAPKRRR